MNYNPISAPNSHDAVATEQAVAEFFRRVFLWMAAGLSITAAVAYEVATTPVLLRAIILNKPVFYIVLFAPLGVLLALGWLGEDLPAPATAAVFILYSAVNGLSFSIIFLAYTHESIAQIFLVASVMFGALALYGFLTQRSLAGIGQLCYTGLIGLIVISILNLFLGNDPLYWALSVVGVLVFSGFTAYDTQKLRLYALENAPNIGSDSWQKMSVFGALRLYLDFINLFLMLLRLLGRRR